MARSLNAVVDEALRVTGRLIAFTGFAGVTFFTLGVAMKPIFPDGLPSGAEGRLLYLMLLVVALMVGTVLSVALLEKGDWSLSGLGKACWSPRALAGGVALGLVVAAALIGADRLLDGAAVAWRFPGGTVATIAVVGTLVDALMLRGYVLGLLGSRLGDLGGAALAAVPATLLALNEGSPTPLAAADAFVLATCLGVFRLRTGSLAAAWLVHLLIEFLADGLGRGPVPGATAGLLAVVTFLLFRLRPATSRRGRA